MKPYSYLFLSFILIFIFSQINSHGFEASTLVKMGGNHKCAIGRVAQEGLAQSICVASYDIQTATRVKSIIKNSGKGRLNCYSILQVNNDRLHTIKCSPLQEFYLPRLKQWRPLYLLQPGDELLNYNNQWVQVTDKVLIAEPLDVYCLEVEGTHTFFVGPYELLTHNIFLPMVGGVALGFNIPFDLAYLGTSLGACFGPVSIVAGLCIGGLISIVANKLLSHTELAPCSINLNMEPLMAFYNKKSDEEEKAQNDSDEKDKEKQEPSPDREPNEEKRRLLTQFKKRERNPKYVELEQEAKKINDKQYIKQGGYEEALKDFEYLEPKNIKTYFLQGGRITKVGELTKGDKVNVRNHSSGKNMVTLEIQEVGITHSTKIRYV